MIKHYYIIKVKGKTQETEDTVSLYLDIPEDLKEKFSYTSGQFITVRARLNGQPKNRAYSISSSPQTDENIRLTVKRTAEGSVSNFLTENVSVGDELEVMRPKGNFTVKTDSNNKTHYFVFGGGSGVAPLISIIKSILTEEPDSRVTLFYFNTNISSIIFRAELEEISEKFNDNFQIVHILTRPDDSWKGRRGRINSDSAKDLISEYKIDKFESEKFLLCGHPVMMEAVEKALTEMNISAKDIHKEIYTLKKISTDESELIEEIVKRKVKVLLYSEEYDLEVEPEETIMIAALEAGIDPPFSCQMGTCSTCRAKLVSGKVFMEEREALTDEEIEQGFILTCQSHPLTDDVIIDYDEY